MAHTSYIGVFSHLEGEIRRYELKSIEKVASTNPEKLLFRKPDWDLVFMIGLDEDVLRFKRDPHDDFYVSETTCPRTTSHRDDVLKPMRVSEDGKSLEVKNKNKDRGRFYFSLNFEGDDYGRPRQYDPVIENRNGQNSISPTSFLLVAVGAVFVALGLRHLFGRDRDRIR